MGYVLLGERLDAQEIIGALIIIAALAVIDGRVLGVFSRSVIKAER